MLLFCMESFARANSLLTSADYGLLCVHFCLCCNKQVVRVRQGRIMQERFIPPNSFDMFAHPSVPYRSQEGPPNRHRPPNYMLANYEGPLLAPEMVVSRMADKTELSVYLYIIQLVRDILTNIDQPRRQTIDQTCLKISDILLQQPDPKMRNNERL